MDYIISPAFYFRNRIFWIFWNVIFAFEGFLTTQKSRFLLRFFDKTLISWQLTKTLVLFITESNPPKTHVFMWIMWITFRKSTIFPRFFGFRMWISWKLLFFHFRLFFTFWNIFVHFANFHIISCRKPPFHVSDKLCVKKLHSLYLKYSSLFDPRFFRWPCAPRWYPCTAHCRFRSHRPRS